MGWSDEREQWPGQCPERISGQQGRTVSAIGYGSMGISTAYGPGDEQEGIATIQRAHEVTLTEADLAAIHDILPEGGFGARYAGGHVPTWD